MTRASNKLLIAASCVLNVALAVAVAHLDKTRSFKPPEKVSIVTNFILSTTVQKISTETPQAVTNFSPLAFHWREIESEDYPAYIANLRNIHCPEKTIRSILIPDIEELYGKRRREEMSMSPTNFWISGRARVAFNRERQQKVRAFDNEESALIKQLLGIDWIRPEHGRGFNQSLEYIGLPYLMTSSLSIEKTKEFSLVMQKYERLEREVDNETGGILLPADESKLKELKSRMKSELMQLMPSQEFEEFNLRLAAVQSFETLEHLKDSDLVLSPDEFRTLVRLKTARRDLLDNFSFNSGPGDIELTPQQKKVVEQATKAFLGDARYAKFQEATDDNFRSAKVLSRIKSSPPQKGRALYDIQQAAESQAEEIRANQSLSAADRKRALQEVRMTTEAVLSQMFDEKTLKTYYKEQGNNWISGISKKSK